MRLARDGEPFGDVGVRCVLEQGPLLALLDALLCESAASGGPGSALQPSGGPAEQDV